MGLASPAVCPPVPFMSTPRSSSLAQVNSMLREQLDQANSANQALSEDIRKVTSDWTRSRKELEQREAAWRREEEVGTGLLGGHWGLGVPGWPAGKGHRRVVRTKEPRGEGERERGTARWPMSLLGEVKSLSS